MSENKLKLEFTAEETEQLTSNSEAVKTAAKVSIRNGRIIEDLLAKVDTIGVTTVRQTKTQNQSNSLLVENHQRLQDIETATKGLNEHVTVTADTIKRIDETSVQNFQSIEALHEKIEEVIEKTDELKGFITDELTDHHTHQMENMSQFEKRINNILEHIERLDYKEVIETLTTNVNSLQSFVTGYADTSSDNYDKLSKQLDLLELASKNTLSSAKAYQNGLVMVTEQVSNMTQRIDSIEQHVSDIHLKPTLSSHDAIMEMFNRWDEPKEPKDDIEETPVETEQVDDVVEEVIPESIPEPEVTPKAKKRFFGLF